MTLRRLMIDVTKVRTLSVTFMAMWACSSPIAAQADAAASCTGATTIEASAWIRHPATATDAFSRSLEADVRPMPFGLPELSSASVRAVWPDTARTLVVGLDGLAGRVWTDLTSATALAWRLADDVDVGVTGSVSLAGGSHVIMAMSAMVACGMRWHPDTAWTVGVSLLDLAVAGSGQARQPTINIGVARSVGSVASAAVDIALAPSVGPGVLLGTLVHVHQRVDVRCCVRTQPMCTSVSARCVVGANIAVRCTIDAVRDLGIRSSLGVTWAW